MLSTPVPFSFPSFQKITDYHYFSSQVREVHHDPYTPVIPLRVVSIL